jgi:DNA polymerase bacteriophage-type
MTSYYVYLDTETRSRVPIARGNDLYTRNAECMIVTYAIGDTPVELWEVWKDRTLPNDLWGACCDPNAIFVAHNAVFDRLILLRCLGIRLAVSADSPYGDVERWRCTRAQAYSHGLPGSLELLGLVCGLSEDQGKLVDDSKLIHTFCVPQGGRFIEPWEAPNEWTRFCAYAVRDTEALREIHRRLPTVNYGDKDLPVWWLDQLLNERGFQFDSALAVACVDFLSDAKVSSDVEMHKHSRGVVHAATQRDRLLRFLRERLDIPIDNLSASEVREWLEHDDLDPVARLLLEQRLDAAKSSGSKYARGLNMVGPRGRQRNTIQFNGAGRTGRDSGRGFQPHNMARPVVSVRGSGNRIELSPVKAKYIDDVIIPGIYSKSALRNDLVYGGPNEAASLALRHVITAAPGNELVVGDWKNIESVITAWIAGQDDELEAFRAAFADPTNKALDVYRKQFSAFFGTPVLDVNDNERQAGKVSKLAFGFGGGVGALVTMAAGYQMDLEPLAEIVLPRATESQRAKAYQAWRRAFVEAEDYEIEPAIYQACDVLKQVYRATNSKINRLRYDIGSAVNGAIRRPNEASFRVGRCLIWSNGQYLVIQLPSGRRLLYAGPELKQERLVDPLGEEPTREVSYLTFLTARGKSWRRIRAWPGLVLENIVQAIAADIKKAKSLALHLDTWSVPAIRAYLETLPSEERTALVLMVHDELAIDVPSGSYPQKRLAEIMTAPIDWAPGLPLAVDTWNNFRYGKR